MAKAVVVFHSGYGHTARVAEFVAKGANAELIAIDANGDITEAQWASIDAADAIIFGSPTYMGMASWQFKKFADASSKRWFGGAWEDKIAGGFTISASLSGDKLSTIQYFMTLSNRIGSNSGLMAQAGPTAPAADIPQGDLDTAERYGARVSKIAAKFRG
jgi:NAD(P)H dehydrogenase (quinone)